MTSAKTVLGLCVLTAAVAWGVWHHQTSLHGREGLATPREDQASTRRTENFNDTRSFAAVLRKALESGEIPKPTAAQLRGFVEKEGHDASCLLAAWQISGDVAWLEEAARKHPDNARVALAMLSKMDELGSQSREWIARLKQADPGNGLAWCYDAMRSFKDGSPETAGDLLTQAAQIGRLDGYFRDSAAGMERAYRSAGFDGLAAESLGLYSVLLPQAQLLSDLKTEVLRSSGSQLGEGLVQDMLALAEALRGGEEPRPLVNDLVGAVVEQRMLEQFNALDIVPGTNEIVGQRLADLDSRRASVLAVTRQAAPLLSTMSESEWKQYIRRTKVDGELKAMQWLIQRRPQAK